MHRRCTFVKVFDKICSICDKDFYIHRKNQIICFASRETIHAHDMYLKFFCVTLLILEWRFGVHSSYYQMTSDRWEGLGFWGENSVNGFIYIRLDMHFSVIIKLLRLYSRLGLQKITFMWYMWDWQERKRKHTSNCNGWSCSRDKRDASKSGNELSGIRVLESKYSTWFLMGWRPIRIILDNVLKQTW